MENDDNDLPLHLDAFEIALQHEAVQRELDRFDDYDEAQADPTFQRAFRPVYDAVLANMERDLFHFERLELARLRAIADDTPGNPRPLTACRALASHLWDFDHATAERGRICAAKHILTALWLAQQACGEKPLPEAAAALTDRQRAILAILAHYPATMPINAVSITEVLAKLPQDASDQHTGTIMRGMIKDGWIGSMGVRKYMRYYLTERGAAAHEYIQTYL